MVQLQNIQRHDKCAQGSGESRAWFHLTVSRFDMLSENKILHHPQTSTKTKCSIWTYNGCSSLTREDRDIGAVHELLGVREEAVTTVLDVEVHPVFLSVGALPRPRRRVELFISRVLALVSGVCGTLIHWGT